MSESIQRAVDALREVPAVDVSLDDAAELQDAYETLAGLVDAQEEPPVEESETGQGSVRVTRGGEEYEYDAWDLHNTVVRALARTPQKWTTAVEVGEALSWSSPGTVGTPLKDLFEAGYADRRGAGGQSDPYEYRLKDPYRREAAQWDPLNDTEEAEA